MLWCLIEVEQHPGTAWRPWNVQKPMGSTIFIIIAPGAQTVLNFLITITVWWSKIHGLPADVQCIVVLTKTTQVFVDM